MEERSSVIAADATTYPGTYYPATLLDSTVSLSSFSSLDFRPGFPRLSNSPRSAQKDASRLYQHHLSRDRGGQAEPDEERLVSRGPARLEAVSAQGIVLQDPTFLEHSMLMTARTLVSHSWVFDVGEGTQHRFIDPRCKLPLSKVSRIFITHMHGESDTVGTRCRRSRPQKLSKCLTRSLARAGDHINGLPGLLCTISAGEGSVLPGQDDPRLDEAQQVVRSRLSKMRLWCGLP